MSVADHSPAKHKSSGLHPMMQNSANRSSGLSPDRFGRSPTVEEQKSLNMAESLNLRAMEADGHNMEECNWYELRPEGTQPHRRAYHSTFIYNGK